jgi:microcin C transport system substrate-binding protein
MKLSRRSILRGSVALATPAALDALSLPLTRLAVAEPSAGDLPWRHGLSLFGEVKYPAGFKHFDYVNPQAPKAGTVRLNTIGTFDNFNMAVAGVRGQLSAGLNLVYNSLMADAMDEVSTEYGLLAEAVQHPVDFSSVTYRLRAEARWHDGRPVTPEDVIFSLDAFKKYHPQYAAYYRHVTKAEKTGDRDVTFRFDGPGNRELPQIVGQLYVLPKHWWEGVDGNGNKRDIGATRLEPPLGCGPYRVKSFVAGRTVIFERVADYWAKDLNVNVGRDNFDEVRFEYFRDTTVALEAFKGDNLDWRTENSALNWATRYDFPARTDKRVILEEFAVRNRGGMQAFVFNTRRAKFADPRVRRAFNYAFDFEEMNKQLFFGQYTRIASYFEGTELASRGLPEGEELAILEAVRDKVPPEVFTTPYTNPVGGTPERFRANLREGVRLLKDAGWEVRDRRLVSAKSKEPMTIEFLSNSPSLERMILFYKPALERLGVTVTARTVDDVQYENRLRSWDYDAIVESWPQSLSPGNEQRDYWGSAAADRSGSRNLIGIKDAAIDALIERVIFAKNRAGLVAASKALDRVLLHHHFVVPQFTYGKVRTARWDRFDHPEKMPRYGEAAFPTIWWWDAARAAKTGSRQ